MGKEVVCAFHERTICTLNWKQISWIVGERKEEFVKYIVEKQQCQTLNLVVKKKKKKEKLLEG